MKGRGGKEPPLLFGQIEPRIREGDDRICLLLNLGLATPLHAI